MEHDREYYADNEKLLLLSNKNYNYQTTIFIHCTAVRIFFPGLRRAGKSATGKVTGSSVNSGFCTIFESAAADANANFTKHIALQNALPVILSSFAAPTMLFLHPANV